MEILEEKARQFSESYPENDCVRQDIINAFIAGSEWADKNPINQWISIEENLPDTDNGQSLREVLVKTTDNRYTSCVNINVESLSKKGYITHWMEIPQ